jgi:hypothetical protein
MTPSRTAERIASATSSRLPVSRAVVAPESSSARIAAVARMTSRSTGSGRAMSR